MNRFDQSWPWWRWALTGLSAIGLGLSAFLGWQYLVGGPAIGCGDGSPCDQILRSRWSAIGRVPVSGLAAGTYLALLVASFFIGSSTEASVRRLAWRSMLVLAGAAVGGAVWFIIVQKWIIGAFCPYCMATHITGFVLASLVIWRAPKSSGDFSDARPTNMTPANGRNNLPHQEILPGTGRRAALVGLALAGIMAVCQASFAPASVSRGGESQNRATPVDSYSVPLVGSPDAPNVVSVLFDYQCSHCQQLHFMLNEAVRRYSGKLAFALCPTPLNTRCNPFVPRDTQPFKDSCELAKMGLAVWLANREAFPAFELWMFTMESGDRWHPRNLDAARAKAVELVGRAELDAALADPWIDRYLQRSVQLFGDTGSTALPKLVFGSRWVIPQPQDADDLMAMLEKSLAIPSPR